MKDEKKKGDWAKGLPQETPVKRLPQETTASSPAVRMIVQP